MLLCEYLWELHYSWHYSLRFTQRQSATEWFRSYFAALLSFEKRSSPRCLLLIKHPNHTVFCLMAVQEARQGNSDINTGLIDFGLRKLLCKLFLRPNHNQFLGWNDFGLVIKIRGLETDGWIGNTAVSDGSAHIICSVKYTCPWDPVTKQNYWGCILFYITD